MKLTASLLAIASIALSPSAFAQHTHDHGHDHGNGGHVHEVAQEPEPHDHGGHQHGDEDHGERHAMTMAEGSLSLFSETATAAGSPVSVRLSLRDSEGNELKADDLAENHGKKLHVMIVDAALEDYIHDHPEAAEDGTFSVSFTPREDRTYRVWAGYYVAGDQDGEGRGHHDAPTGTPTLASASLVVGDGEGPGLPKSETLFVDTGDLRFRLLPEDEIKAGKTVRMRVSVTDANGKPFRGLEPIMEAYAHLVGFNEGATTFAHAHPAGAHPHGDDSRGGPDLAFDVKLYEPGPHRLFLQTKTGGEESTAVFTVIVQP